MSKIKILDFLQYNKEKRMTLSAYMYSYYYRIRINLSKQSGMESIMGIRGEESSYHISKEEMHIASLVAKHTNRITTHTPWEKKCLVRALTIQRLLKARKIPSTLYLGVRKEKGKMSAHAWLRCGEVYLTGGNGEGYATVDKFRA